jgi:hypothetical protein
MQLSEDYSIAFAAKLRLLDPTVNAKWADAMAQYRRGYKFCSYLRHRKAKRRCGQQRQSDADSSASTVTSCEPACQR